ncbi:MAG TPA: TraB/GumN family protein [Rhizomicrobium sp.]|jgi:hypothetical protein
MRLFRFLLLLAFASSALAQTDLGKIEAHPAMWVVHGKVGTAYLFGSIHILPPNVAWHSAKLDAAMTDADTFVFEVPLDDSGKAEAQAFIAQHGTLPAGTTLPSLLTPEARADYDAALAMTHLPPAALADKRPWMAALVIEVAMMMREGYSPDAGIDREILGYATAHGRQLRYFETIDQQMTMLAPPDTKLEVKEFSIDLKSLRKEPVTLGALVDAWSHADTRQIDKLMNSDLAKEPGAKKLLLDDRNKAWVTKLQSMLAENHTYFITVGAAHLAGPGGVPSLLHKQGLQVDGP